MMRSKNMKVSKNFSMCCVLLIKIKLIIQAARYVSAIESCDKLFGFFRIKMSHTIYRMQFHLEDEQNVVFTNDTMRQAAESAANRDTMLTAWFKLNQLDQNANQYLYAEISNSYVFNKLKKEWTVRKKGDVISRLYNIHPKNRELFHLRILLMHIRGATSFEDLRTVVDLKSNKAVVWNTFTQTAIALNLIDNDQQWFECINEAILTELPNRLRFLFVMICIHCTPVLPDALAIWKKFKVDFGRDYLDLSNDSEETAIQKALQHIKYMLNQNGQDTINFGLPEPDYSVGDWRDRNRPELFTEPTPEEHMVIADKLCTTLNRNQRVYMKFFFNDNSS